MTRAGNRRDRGAVAIFVALTIVVVLAGAAFALDGATLAMNRQRLHDDLDSAAQIGASLLPSSPSAATDAVTSYLASVEPKAVPDVTLWCVVAATVNTDDKKVLTSQVPSECDPGTPGPYYSGTEHVTCSNGVCAIPCTIDGRCNAIRVTSNLDVSYYFAPAIGVTSSNTGTQTSVSCVGACGRPARTTSDTQFIDLPAAA